MTNVFRIGFSFEIRESGKQVEQFIRPSEQKMSDSTLPLSYRNAQTHQILIILWWLIPESQKSVLCHSPPINTRHSQKSRNITFRNTSQNACFNKVVNDCHSRRSSKLWSLVSFFSLNWTLISFRDESIGRMLFSIRWRRRSLKKIRSPDFPNIRNADNREVCSHFIQWIIGNIPDCHQ
jgi:hypothetical protein